MASPQDETAPSTTHLSVEHLQGVIERLTFHSEESGYTVARLHVPGQRELVTIIGQFPDIHAGQTLHLTGFWKEHPKFGRQFQVTSARETKPATLTGLEKYLGSGLIKGIGPATAKRIVKHFGLETLEIIEQSCARLIEVPGIGERRASMIERAWEAQKAIKEVMLFLQGHSVSTTYAVKIYKHYGDQAIEVVSRNPYQLASDIYGIGFITADTIARNLGIAPDSDFRYRAGVIHILNMASEEGHCFLPAQELLERAGKQLSLEEYPVDPARLEALILQMAEAKELIIEQGYGDLAEHRLCYLPAFYHTEVALAKRLARFAEQPIEVDMARVGRWIDGYTAKKGITLSAEQRQAVELAASSRMLILTGETSMMDLFLSHSLLKALPPASQLLLVGDIDQLPSVGPGMVLRDLIESAQIPVVRLKTVFRQAATSHIITNAHRINAGQMPRLVPLAQADSSDCLWMEADEPVKGVEAIVNLVTDMLPKRGIDPVKDVQVLCPATRGDIGTRQLNTMLQQILNPAHSGKTELTRGGTVLRVGDRVIQQVNNYQLEVFNGDLGTIARIDLEEQEVRVRFAEREVSYDYADVGELALAWAITVHKSQGSEFHTVLFPLFMQHYVLLSRNLTYTGLTRAKNLAVLIGSPKAIGLSVKRVTDRQRYTALADRLRNP